MNRCLAFAPLIFALLALTACPGGSAGEITNTIREDLSFISDQQILFVHPQVNRNGIIRLNVDGTNRFDILSPDYRVRSASTDGSLWSLGDPDNNLYTLHAFEDPRQVDFFDGQVSHAPISPDGSTIAVTLHQDFRLPQDERPGSVDDTIFLVDPQTHEVRTIPNQTDHQIRRLAWTTDSQSLYIRLDDDQQFLVDLTTEERTELEDPYEEQAPNHPFTRPVCSHDGTELAHDDQGIELIRDDDERRERLVHIEGRERGFHDYESTVSQPFFTKSCETVVFVYNRSVWVVDVESGVVGELAEGRGAFILPDL